MSSSTPDLMVEEVVSRYANILASDPHTTVRMLGRVHVLRHHGRLAFADVFHGGARLQVALRSNVVQIPDHLPAGTWVRFEGEVYPSQRGELTLWATHIEIVQRPSRPIEQQPDDGRVPPEQRFVVDPLLTVNARRRCAVVRALREELWGEQFEEMETPILHRSASGAAARPFQTWSRAMETELSLRVAPEPHLIRLLAAGFPRVFEIARAFRNEGVSPRHQPEFTLIEVYQSNATLTRSIAHCTQLIHAALGAAGVSVGHAPFGGHRLDWRTPRVVSLRTLVGEVAGCYSEVDCAQWLQSHGHAVPQVRDEYWVAVFEHAVEHALIQPTFVVEWPVSISPLASSDDGRWACRFELFAGGMEIANGFEQNRDEDEQRARFTRQAQRCGGEDVMDADEDYLFAMGWGLPPLSGFGIGIDRLVMLALNHATIREAVLFPM